MKEKNQFGRTMTEMLAVLAIMGIITYGAISGINYGMTSYKVNQLYVEIGDIINGIQDMYLAVRGRNSFPVINCDNTGNTPIGCDVFINHNILNPKTKVLKIRIDNNNNLIVTLEKANRELCRRLKEMDWDIQSINCYVDASFSNNCSENTCGGDNKLYFSPK